MRTYVLTEQDAREQLVAVQEVVDVRPRVSDGGVGGQPRKVRTVLLCTQIDSNALAAAG